MRTPSRGFSFIEVIIVMLAVGVLIFALTPKDSLLRFNLETAAARVEQDIRYAQELAMITNTSCGVNFIANGDYTVYQQATTNPVINPFTKQSFIANIGQTFKTVNIANSVQFEFDFLGRPVIGSGQSVQITNGQTTATLLVTPSTGVIVRQ